MADELKRKDGRHHGHHSRHGKKERDAITLMPA